MIPKGQTLINLHFATVPSLLLWLRIFRPNFANMSFQKLVNTTLLNVVNMRVYLQPTALTMRTVPENAEKSLFFQIFETPPTLQSHDKIRGFFVFVFLIKMCYIFI